MSGTIPLLDSDDAPEDLGAVAESSAPPQEWPVVAPPEAGPAQPGVGPAQPGAEARPVESAPSAEPTTSADRKPEKDVAEEPVEPEESVEPEPARPAEADATERTATAEAEGSAESAEEQDAEAVEASAEPEQDAEAESTRPAETEPVESETAEKPVEAVVEEPAVEPEPEEPAKTQTAEEPAAVSDPAAPSPGVPTAVRTRKATTAGANVAHPPLRPRFSLSAPTPATAAESAAGADSADMPLPPSVPPVARTPERTRDERTSAEPAPDEQKKSEAAAPARRRRLPLILGAAAVLLVLIWGAIAFATTRHIFAGSTVSGVAVGNMSPAQAESTVAGAINAQLGQPVTLVVGNATDTLVPAESGVSVDARASVERLTGFTLNPLTLIGRLRGADVDAVTRVDARSLTTALDARLDVLAVGASDAGVTLNGTTPVLVPGSIGTGLDVDSAVTALSESWPLGRETIELPDGEARPAITDEEAQTLIDKVLTPLLSGDFTITVEGTDAAARAWRPTVVLTPEQLAELVRIGTADGDITASLDPQGLRETVLAAMGPEIESPVQDATWTIEGRADAKPVYVEAHGGTVVDTDALAANVLTAATRDGGAGERRIALPMIDQAPAVTTPAADWGMNQVIGEYSTPYYPDAARTQNLVAGTAAINGTIVMPGGVFSLTDALGPIDEEHGFASAGVVTNGQHTDAMGGGLSQVATTVFNAGFEAGMDDVEHTPHNYWFTRYPAGREATLWTGNLDVKFGNSTPTAVLVQAWAVDGEVHVRLWGTPYYRVSIDNGTPHNYRAYRTQRQSGANCVPYEGGAQGFDITVTRSRTKPDGQKLPDDVLTTSYDSDNPITCG